MSHTLAENELRLSNALDSMSTALTEKGVTIPSHAGFEDIASTISTINVPVKLTPVTSTISQSDMYALNVGTQTIVFGSFTKSSTGSSVFSFPSSFNFAHTRTHTYWLYISDTASSSGSRQTSSYGYSVSTAKNQVTLYCYSSGTKYNYVYWFY